MKKVLVLSRFVHEHEPVRLVEEARAVELEVDLVKYGQISLGVSADGEPLIDLGEGRKFEDYGLIVPRSASKKGGSMVAVKTALLEQAALLGIKVVNGKTFEKFPLLGKVEQGLMLAKEKLPTVPFVTFGSKNGWNDYLESEILFPIMVKGRFGSHGNQVKKVEDKKTLRKLVGKYKEGNVMIQPVLPVKVWYRTIVCHGKYLGQMRHKQNEKFEDKAMILETSQIGERELERLKELSLAATKLFECDYAGLDIGWREDIKDWVIFEVNRTAQFKYFERRTKVNVAKELISI